MAELEDKKPTRGAAQQRAQTTNNNSTHTHMTNQNQPTDIIDIPQIENYDMFERNQERAYSLNLDHCPCCGKAITNPKYFINSIYGGCAYPANDTKDYLNSWVMAVGSECRKKFPTGYVFTL